MSVLIKDMEMPTRCGRCDMCVKEVDGDIDYHYECCITAAVIKNLGEKMVDCPLVPVPPHGDLVDRAEIREIAISLLDKAVTDQEANAIREMWSCLGQMPVYILAEEGET